MHKIDEDEDLNVISKSQRKRDSHALQDLGEALSKLGNDTLKKFPLTPELYEALVSIKKIAPSKHTARKRNLQYIGKLMRLIEDVEPIATQYAELKAPSQQQIAFSHLAENWRDRMLADSPDGAELAAFALKFPAVNVEELAHVIAETKVERAAKKPPKHYRLLYKEVHRLILAQSKET
jgi:ribosome-associated protein